MSFTASFGPSRPGLDDVAPEPSEATDYGSAYWNTLSCPQRHKLSVIDRLVPARPSDALDIGIMFHRVRGAYFEHVVRHPLPPGASGSFAAAFRERHTALAVAAARVRLEAFTAAFERAGSREGVELVDQVQFYWQGYLAYWGDDTGYQLGRMLMVERLLHGRLPGADWQGDPPLGDGLGGPLTARLDTAALVGRGAATIFEAKTSAMKTRDVREGFSLDAQLLRQAYLWMLGYQQGLVPAPLRAVTVDICFKLKSPEYERITFTYDDHDIARYLRSMQWAQVRLVAAAAMGWPCDFTQCRTVYGLCSFFSFCLNHGQSAMGYRRRKENT